MNTRKTGDWYECKAIQMLKEQGVTILERNYRTRVGEVDIVAKDCAFLVFIEVKYRKNMNLGIPEEAVGEEKQRKICMVAKKYLYKWGISYDTPVRFDVVVILGSEIKWYKNAFDFQ